LGGPNHIGVVSEDFLVKVTFKIRLYKCWLGKRDTRISVRGIVYVKVWGKCVAGAQ
jgi:hypothetical protein